jgi:anti-sigma B factor antagonist
MPQRRDSSSDAASSVAPFSIANERHGELIVLAVRGELDLFTAPELRERLAEHIDGADGDLVVDLSECGFVDASGAHALLGASRRLANRGRRLAVVNGGHGNARVLEVMGLDELLVVVPTRAAAAAALG